MVHIRNLFIETELLPDPENGHELRVFNCLFSDMEIHYY